MLLASYDESDAYLTKEDVNELHECDEENNPGIGYNEIYDEMNWDNFKYEVRSAFEKRKFPVILQANNSNWRGQTGFAKAENTDDLIGKIASFDSSYYKLHRTRGSALYFSLGTHDVPMGFTIDIKPYTNKLWDGVS